MFENRSVEYTNRPSPETSTRRGPPNRMNDLSYKEWMRFQKSFFRHTSFRNLVQESVHFFTKAIWPDGNPSRSLIVGFEDSPYIAAPRQVENLGASSLDGIGQIFREKSGRYDFIFVNLIRFLRSETELTEFLKSSDVFFESLRKIMVPDRYCGLIVGMPTEGGAAFPIPWSVALASRNRFRLRDEKVGLIEETGQIYYCIFLQAQQDEREAVTFSPSSIELADQTLNIPAWIIPRPPPRKKHEMLHPAKFPEMLVTEFIELFSKHGDTVFDPMSGTGSAILAAVRSQRNAVGVELIQDFVDIAQRRLAEEYPNVLFEEMRPSAWWKILQGDATKLDQVQQLSGMQFGYCVTSPPYWSMLTSRGSEGQEARRKRNLPLVYSDDERDLGNIQDYDRFLDVLTDVYDDVAKRLATGGYLTIIVKNVKRSHVVYPIAADLVTRLSQKGGNYQFAGQTLWCQDDVKLKPFAVGIYWVSNTLHQYCLHFKKK